MTTDSSPGYSRAFERFVGEDSDVGGLLAYALYKQNIQQRRLAGQSVPAPAERDPAPAEQRVYRGEAQRLLNAVGVEAVEGAAPGILQDALIEAQQETREVVVAEVRRRTGVVSAIVIGVITWLVTIGMTVLIALAEPDWVRNLVEHVNKAG